MVLPSASFFRHAPVRTAWGCFFAFRTIYKIGIIGKIFQIALFPFADIMYSPLTLGSTFQLSQVTHDQSPRHHQP